MELRAREHLLLGHPFADQDADQDALARPDQVPHEFANARADDGPNADLPCRKVSKCDYAYLLHLCRGNLCDSRRLSLVHRLSRRVVSRRRIHDGFCPR